MDNIENLLKGTVEELDRLLNAKNVLGDPIEKEGSIVIPMVSYGFGFGAGGTSGGKAGSGGGTGAGGGIKPLRGADAIDLWLLWGILCSGIALAQFPMCAPERRS